MIRKAIIVVLTLAGVGTASFAVRIGLGANYRRWVDYRPSPTQWIILQSSYRRVNLTVQWQAARVTVPNNYHWDYWRNALAFGSVTPIVNDIEHCVVYVQAHAATLSVPFAIFAAYPTVAFIRGPVRRWRRRRRGLCVRCGYNLTGNVSGVCSECGAEVKKA